MNYPSCVDEVKSHPEWNQNPSFLLHDLTARQALNGATLKLSSSRSQQVTRSPEKASEEVESQCRDYVASPTMQGAPVAGTSNVSITAEAPKYQRRRTCKSIARSLCGSRIASSIASNPFIRSVGYLASFVGPGFLIAVAYIDPGNYSTDVAAGAATKYQLLFIVLMSNVFAVVLQALSVRLGTVTGKNLSENCRAHLPRWLNISIYVLAEAALIATDIAEVWVSVICSGGGLSYNAYTSQVIGSAIALNLLFNIPLVAGCAITLVDVLLILLFYTPEGSLSRLRLFECFVAALVMAVVVCFCVQLSLLTNTSAGQVFFGYLPSAAVVEGEGVYLSCGILGATVMPHSIFLGSGLVKPRLRRFDEAEDTAISQETPQVAGKVEYKPSLKAIKHCLKYSTIELAISLTGFALFVNSAILIVAGASLFSNSAAQTADLFGVYDLLSSSITSAAGTIFAVALFFSGTAAGIVCTIAGQMVSEGHINWTMAPWLRRLLTRSITIVPSIIVAATLGRAGLSAALNASQVALSIILPFVTAPLIYFTCQNKYMTVNGTNIGSEPRQEWGIRVASVPMRNHWIMSCLAVLVWLVITIMNIALLVFLGLGKS
ncbi:MAG: hypothetical protein LQ340_005258 [Diploschistes diacapsis]|nr:MAG: hypothetical protein LQ340_005258 [Diploschistes diacapsis]